MADAGARLFIVGYESGDPQILKNIKKGATVEHARQFTKNCKKVGIKIHGDFIIGLPGETKETIQRTLRSEEHTSELQSPCNLVCRLLLEKKKKKHKSNII